MIEGVSWQVAKWLCFVLVWCWKWQRDLRLNRHTTLTNISMNDVRMKFPPSVFQKTNINQINPNDELAPTTFVLSFPSVTDLQLFDYLLSHLDPLLVTFVSEDQVVQTFCFMVEDLQSLLLLKSVLLQPPIVLQDQSGPLSTYRGRDRIKTSETQPGHL